MHLNCNIDKVKIKPDFKPLELEYDWDTTVKKYEYDTKQMFDPTMEECPLKMFQISKIVDANNKTELSEIDFIDIDEKEGKLTITKFDEPMEVHIYI